MGLLSLAVRKSAKFWMAVLAVQVVSPAQSDAGQVFDFSGQQVVAVSSLEHSSHLTFEYPDTDILSVKSLSQNRADLICQSKGFASASSYDTRESVRVGLFVVYESLLPEQRVLPVVAQIEFIDAQGKTISFGQKARLSDEESKLFKRYHPKQEDKKIVPHFLFSQIVCEETVADGYDANVLIN